MCVFGNVPFATCARAPERCARVDTRAIRDMPTPTIHYSRVLFVTDVEGTAAFDFGTEDARVRLVDELARPAYASRFAKYFDLPPRNVEFVEGGALGNDTAFFPFWGAAPDYKSEGLLLERSDPTRTNTDGTPADGANRRHLSVVFPINSRAQKLAVAEWIESTRFGRFLQDHVSAWFGSFAHVETRALRAELDGDAAEDDEAAEDDAADDAGAAQRRPFASASEREAAPEAPDASDGGVHPALRAVSDELFAVREELPDGVYQRLENRLKRSHEAMAASR